jgi:hypothetical protein
MVARRRVEIHAERRDAAGPDAVLAAGIKLGADAGAGGRRHRAFDKILAVRQPGHRVDGAAGGTATEREGRRSLVDLDAIRSEQVARIPTRIAHAVAEQVATRDEAANEWTVALLAAFARREGDARDGAQRILHGVGALLLNDLLRHHVDGLRHIAQRHR